MPALFIYFCNELVTAKDDWQNKKPELLPVSRRLFSFSGEWRCSDHNKRSGGCIGNVWQLTDLSGSCYKSSSLQIIKLA